MAQTPVIVISSSQKGTGKTTLALNLAAALWSDGYKVGLFAPDNLAVRDFLEKRTLMNTQCNVDMPLPLLVETISDSADEKSVVIAVIPSDKNENYADVFYKAHTLISVGCEKADFDWSFAHPYVNLIWQVKKNAAANGVKYLNWIAVQNRLYSDKDNLKEELAPLSKQLGFRISEPLYFRNSYRYVQSGYCVSDMAKYRATFKMSMPDVYARREILNLTDDLWKHK